MTYSETLSAENNIREPRVAELRDTGLLAEVESDIAHVRLHLAERESEFVVVLVLDRRIWRELDEVVGLERDDVREQVAAREREVLDDEVERVVRVLDARNGDVANLGKRVCVRKLLMR